MGLTIDMIIKDCEQGIKQCESFIKAHQKNMEIGEIKEYQYYIDRYKLTIDIMHKYQKIEKIVNNTFQNITKEDEQHAYEWLEDIKEVLEDGNDD